MKKLSFLLCLLMSSSAFAQSPSRNLMPDGSFDSYIGLGVISRPTYEGSERNKRNAVPVFQIEWSNGLYIAGMSAGWHLSETPQVEYGPLLQLEPGRTPSGLGNSIDTPMYQTSSVMGPEFKIVQSKLNRLEGMVDIKSTLLAGGFYHYRLTDNLRHTNTLLYGAGNDRKGLRLSSDLSYRFNELPTHHSLSLGLGITVINQAYAQSYFGVTEQESERSINEEFHPKAGVKDVHLDLNWNYSLSSSWLITSKLRASQLLGKVKDSPLVEKKNGLMFSTALAYRF